MLVIRTLAAIGVILLAQGLAPGQDAPAGTPAATTSLTPSQQQALQKGTALFIVTAILLLLMLVAVVVATITLRRRVAALEKTEKLKPTDFENLWWKTGGPPGEDKTKEKK
jgi:hypothetical protein